MHLPQYLQRVRQCWKRGPAARKKSRLRSRKPTVERLEDRITPSDFLVTNIAEFTRAMRDVLPGDTVTMANGTWENVNLLFKPSRNGVPTPSITLRAQTPGQVILTGSSQLRIAGNDLVVDGLQFTGVYTGTGRDVVAFRESATGVQSDHSRLTNCAIVDYNPPAAETDTGSNYRVVGEELPPQREREGAFGDILQYPEHLSPTGQVGWVGRHAETNEPGGPLTRSAA
jgi:hypothetical protein